jgi:hypothetical protein
VLSQTFIWGLYGKRGQLPIPGTALRKGWEKESGTKGRNGPAGLDKALGQIFIDLVCLLEQVPHVCVIRFEKLQEVFGLVLEPVHKSFVFLVSPTSAQGGEMMIDDGNTISQVIGESF